MSIEAPHRGKSCSFEFGPMILSFEYAFVMSTCQMWEGIMNVISLYSRKLMNLRPRIAYGGNNKGRVVLKVPKKRQRVCIFLKSKKFDLSRYRYNSMLL